MSKTPENPGLRVFTPANIGSMRLRNRIIRSGCFEGLCPQSVPGQALIEHHRKIAAGGAAMTTVSYCAVSRSGAAFEHEMWMREEIVPELQKLTRAVHMEGAAASIQLGHCGFFANKSVSGQQPIGPSGKLCLFRYSFCRAMREQDMLQVRADFVQAARQVISAGFDAIEIHAGHGYLLSQFLSPWTNHHRDQYGGSLPNRLRFPVSVIQEVRREVGPDYPLLVKMNCEDGFGNGLKIDEAIEVARAFEKAGASLLVPSCGFTARTSLYMLRGNVPIAQYVRSEKNPFTKLGMALFGRLMVREYPFNNLFLLENSKRIKSAVQIPVAYVGGVCSRSDLEKVIQEGFEFVQIGRATIRDPDVVRKWQTGELDTVDCDHCNRCVAEMAGQGLVCTALTEGLLK